MQTNWKHFLKQHENIICDLSHLGFIQVSGHDAKKLLQGQLTCHMDDITPSQGRLSAHCNPQGRVVSLFYIFLLHDSYYLLMPKDMIAVTSAALKKYAVFYKVELRDASNDFMAIGYTGTIEEIQEENEAVISLSSRYIIAGNRETMKHKWQRLLQLSQPVTQKQWQQFDLLDGIPAIHPDTSQKFLPHEINLDKLNALHFDKGCYTGQEIITRMHFRGKIKNRLYQTMITSSSTPTPGTDIYSRDEQKIKANGSIVDICHDEDHRYYALIISNEANAKDQHLFLDTNENDYFTFLNKPN